MRRRKYANSQTRKSGNVDADRRCGDVAVARCSDRGTDSRSGERRTAGKSSCTQGVPRAEPGRPQDVYVGGGYGNQPGWRREKARGEEVSIWAGRQSSEDRNSGGGSTRREKAAVRWRPARWENREEGHRRKQS